ncbi:hypothetical protein [Actinomadura sp. 3N407]|uniref:hypothetical protein n=1 Tax=Actinomadura sp. 3N407 TaxID=3457423 RepID=UPI003FCEC0DE
MSDHHGAGRLDEHTLEGLLGLDGADGHARLHALLSAAAAPARPDELAGEDAAVAAFRAAPHPVRKSRMSCVAAMRRFLTVKALVLVGGSLILTGGAAAAITGNIPGQEASPTPSTTPGDGTGTRQDETPATQFSPGGAPANPEPATPPSASPTPSASKKVNGGSTAPGLGKTKPTPPRNIRTPPRGPGSNQGSPPPDPGGPPGTGTGGDQPGGTRPPTGIKSGNAENGTPAGSPTD